MLRALSTLVLKFADDIEEPAENVVDSLLTLCDIALVEILLVIWDVAACASKAMYSSCVSCPSSKPLAGAWGGSGGR